MSKSTVIAEAENYSTGQADSTQMSTLYDDIVRNLGNMPLFVYNQSATIAAGTAVFDLTTLATAIPEFVSAFIFNDFQLSSMLLRDIEAVNQNWRNYPGNRVTTVVHEEEPEHSIAFYPVPRAPSSTLNVIAAIYPPGGTVPSVFEPMLVHQTLAREYGRPSNHQDLAFAAAAQQLAGFFMQAAQSQMTPPQR